MPVYEEGGLKAALVAGKAFGVEAKVPVFSPLFYVHWEMAAGAKAGLPAEYPERAAYVAVGKVEAAGQVLHAGQMAVFKPGETITFEALEPSTVMLLGGEPVGPRFIEWNFVSSSKERIEQAKADWRAQRMKLPDLDDQEFTPLPEPPPPPPPMS
jgi:redox-sensitive bicupin YhaK (pirin superfamily)